MQPYQTATEEIARQGQAPKRLLQQGIGAATAITGATAFGKSLAQKTLNLVNKYIPENLAIKGLEKLDPRYGKFIKKMMDSGAEWNEIAEFIGGKAQEGLDQEQETQEPAKDIRNLIEKHSPELHQFISNQMKKGKSHKEAGALARIGTGGKAFDKVIDKLTKEHKTTWEDILDAVYGGAQGQPQPAQAPAAQQQQAAQPQQPQQVQGGPGQQALMGILNKINQAMGGQP